MSSLMMVASVCLIVPTTMSSTLDSPEARTDGDILILSHGTAITLFILFVVYLYFQHKTHVFLFLDAPNDGSVRNEERDNPNVAEERDNPNVAEERHNPNVAEEEPTLGPWAAGCVLITTTLCVIGCASYLVDSVDGLAKAMDVGKTFIGLVLIPTACNAAKCVNAIATSRRTRMDLAVRAIVGSVLQIALFVTPFLVLLGWIIEQPMTFNFDLFEGAVLFLAVIVVSCLIQDGRTNYFEGAMMVGT
jgi:Ca2+:H+ antiporter